ncbi:MAG TPA: hypothetical protein VMC61_04345, partial [Methanocella sp.]|nr:hypothetical protein [Methanocella sp.]
MKTEIEKNCNEAMGTWKLIDEYSYIEPPYLPSKLDVGVGENQILRAIKNRVDGSPELHALWACSNVIAVNRLGYSDHGVKHVEIVAGHASKILRLLYEAGVKPSSM